MTARLDRGAAYAVLRTDWRDLPQKDREAAFLDAIEACIEPEPTPPTQPVWPIVLLVLAAVWSVCGAIARLAISLSTNVPIDALPFITLVLSNVALITYFRRTTRRRRQERP